MSSAGKSVAPPPDLRFDTSDTATPRPARPAPVVVSTAGVADRSAPLIVKIPPKDVGRGSESELASSVVESEGAAASFASGSVVSVVPEEAVPAPKPETVLDEPTAPMKMAPTHDVGRATAAQVATPVSAQVATPVSAARVAKDAVAAKDAIAAKRGIERIKMPRVSKRYDAVAAPDASRASGSSRKLVIGSAAVAGTCIVVAMGAILWARSSVSKPEAVAARNSDGTGVAAARTPDAQRAVAHAKAPRVDVNAPVAAPDVVVAAPDVAVAAPDVAVAAPDVAVAAAATCSLEVRANIAGAIVWVDGKRVGAAPATVAAACSAIANVEVRHPRYATFTEAVALDPTAAGGVTSRIVQMEREKTTLTLTSEPAGAQVTYNGSVVGKTPVVVKVPRYEQGTVWFRAPNHEPDWRKIVPNRANKTLSIKLKGMILRPPS